MVQTPDDSPHRDRSPGRAVCLPRILGAGITNPDLRGLHLLCAIPLRAHFTRRSSSMGSREHFSGVDARTGRGLGTEPLAECTCDRHA